MRESDPQNKIEKEDSDEEDSGASGGRGKRAPNPALSDSSLTSKETVAKPAESIADQLKRDGVQLSTHEKRLLSTVVNPDTIPVSFKDLVLPTNTKLILQTLVTLPLLKPHYFKSGILSRHAINGVLLFGPPGTGKTMLAKAVAKSSGARFMSVALSDIFDKYVGEGEKNVKALFTLARKLSPCVVFLDEVDALFGARRSDAAHASRREIINEFMSEWDGLTSNNSGIVIMGATNRPFDLDDAILRRLPRRVMVDLPTEEQRAKIIELHLRGEEVDSTVSLKSLAKQTPSYSGSDLKNVCVAAALTRVKQVLLSETSVGDDAEQGDSESQSRQLVEQLEQLKTKTLEADAANTNAAGNNKPRGRASVRARRSATPTSETPSLPTSPAPVPLPPLQSTHFEIALKEVPPSLTDEMQTLVELKKWDESYGEAAARRKGSAKKGWGFDMAKDGGDLDIKS
ncbi:P-loop containing nucleoside triphosphate hydrolase protein [Phlyctochytrium arcticum]|nr:P-loop containing nucleoside triphosphate hydrolase protein [Phlyctochytrium arcticum]